MATATIHLFLNPTAGRGRAGARQARILALLQEAGLDVELHASRAVGDMESQVLSSVDAGATRIVVAGGDGSVHEAVNGILRSKNSAGLGVIPTGTGNDFAKACSISLNWEHATRLLADRLAANQSARPVDAGKMNNRFFANGAGIGFDAKVTRTAQSIHLPIGDLIYLLAILKAMIDGIATPRVRITADGYSWDGPLTLANISNGPWAGGMFYIAPMADNSDGQLELIIAKPITRLGILNLLPKLVKGTHLQEAVIVHRTVTKLTIQADAPIPSHLDGEVQELQTDFELTILPGALDLL
ncbi:MAG: diacylglycerol kinase family lipid kinase [Proteobacteria bacterium]|nr:diacylglycerol kinase family lipid kinase [Pseudomonadota bacterium]